MKRKGGQEDFRAFPQFQICQLPLHHWSALVWA